MTNAKLIFKHLLEAFPNPEKLLEVSIEELGGLILETLDTGFKTATLYPPPSLYSFLFSLTQALPENVKLSSATKKHIATAWQWLISEIMIVPLPDDNGANGCIFVTEKGGKYAKRNLISEYLKSKPLSFPGLHPKLQDSVQTLFIRGEYDTAIFQAFKQVEVSVRKAGEYSNEDIGVNLMRKAFHPENGPLTDQSIPKAEREAIQQLFSGAIGAFKNPQSHRHVDIITPQEAAEMIMQASYLLRLVDIAISRKK